MTTVTLEQGDATPDDPRNAIRLDVRIDNEGYTLHVELPEPIIHPATLVQVTPSLESFRLPPVWIERIAP